MGGVTTPPVLLDYSCSYSAHTCTQRWVFDRVPPQSDETFSASSSNRNSSLPRPTIPHTPLPMAPPLLTYGSTPYLSSPMAPLLTPSPMAPPLTPPPHLWLHPLPHPLTDGSRHQQYSGGMDQMTNRPAWGGGST